MTVRDLLRICHLKQIELSVEENDLRYRAPTGAMNDAIRRQIVRNKSKIIDWLRKQQSDPHRGVRMTFGKYKGLPVALLPDRYVIRIWENCGVRSAQLGDAIRSRLWEMAYWTGHMRAEFSPQDF